MVNAFINVPLKMFSVTLLSSGDRFIRVLSESCDVIYLFLCIYINYSIASICGMRYVTVYSKLFTSNIH